jgi:hypothetical protein
MLQAQACGFTPNPPDACATKDGRTQAELRRGAGLHLDRRTARMNIRPEGPVSAALIDLLVDECILAGPIESLVIE